MLAALGWQEQDLPKGQDKTMPNHVVEPTRLIHACAPIGMVPAEMHRLCVELASEEFSKAHPILQTSYAHYAFVAIRPFADGNGRVASGSTRRVPMNAVARSVVIDLGAAGNRPDDPEEAVFGEAYRTVARAFTEAVRKAQSTLRAAGKDASRLDGYTWHGNRRTGIAAPSRAG